MDVDSEEGKLLVEELKLLEQLPQVKLTTNAVFDRAVPAGSVAQKRGVICKLLCCGTQLDVKCNDLSGDRACPTLATAARFLRAKVIEKHGSAACLEKAQIAHQEECATQRDGFSVMMAAQRARSTALRKAEHAVAESRRQLEDAREALKSAEMVLANAKEEAEAVQPASKRQRSEAKEWQSRPYAGYSSVEYWRQEESRIWNRRNTSLTGVSARLLLRCTYEASMWLSPSSI